MAGEVVPFRRKFEHLSQYQFKPGQSGNPGGKSPRRKSLSSLLRTTLAGTELLGETVPEGMTVGEFLVHRLIVEAMRGNATAIREVFDRVEGRAPEVDEVSMMDDEALRQRIAEIARGSRAAGADCPVDSTEDSYADDPEAGPSRPAPEPEADQG